VQLFFDQRCWSGSSAKNDMSLDSIDVHSYPTPDIAVSIATRRL
jgi:hypothetical protein